MKYSTNPDQQGLYRGAGPNRIYMFYDINSNLAAAVRRRACKPGGLGSVLTEQQQPCSQDGTLTVQNGPTVTAPCRIFPKCSSTYPSFIESLLFSLAAGRFFVQKPMTKLNLVLVVREDEPHLTTVQGVGVLRPRVLCCAVLCCAVLCCAVHLIVAPGQEPENAPCITGAKPCASDALFP